MHTSMSAYSNFTSGRETDKSWSNQSHSYHNRPRSGQSRPQLARPQTSGTIAFEGSYVIALLEGRGVSREVGIAALDKDNGTVMLVQVADCQTYVKTLHQMHLHSPTLVLVPDTFLSASDASLAHSGKRSASTSMLVEYIREEFSSVPLEPMARKYWNDNGGLEFVLQLCVEDDERAGTVLAVSNKYYALSAACALFKYAEGVLNTRFAPASLRIRYVPVDGTMMIDIDTARNLELIGNMAHSKSTHSLFGVLNHTYTAMAARLLRVNILSPITSQVSVDARLDAVEEMMKTEELFTKIRDALKTLNRIDLDKLTASLATSEARVVNTAKPASQRVFQMLSLRNILKNLVTLRKALEGSQAQLLAIICSILSDERLAKIEKFVCASLNDDCVPAKGGIGAVNARVYAVKANHNRLLDVARETYKENVGDIYQLTRSLSEEHDLPLTLIYQDTGFVFSLKKSELVGELPGEFINAALRKGKWKFSSMVLKKMNARMKDALDETLLLSDKIIQDLVEAILGDIGALYKASEAIALVDMLWSFAHISIMRNYVRPEFTGTLAIRSGRHPILETLLPAGTVVANDVYCDNSSSFQIIQGPNMSGKSTYLKQIGLLLVMSMCGCCVPAEYASFRIHDALLSRLSNDDDMEKSLSTFASEMATSAMILGLVTNKSMILIDELGRGTSPKEGIGISHAIAEKLISQKAFTFFATHFDELTISLSRQPSVVKLHLSVQRNYHRSSSFGMNFQYKVIDGACDELEHYGLELAKLADFPVDIIVESNRVAQHLSAANARNEHESESNKIAIRRKALLRLRTQLTQVLEHCALPDQDIIDYVGRFQADIVKAFLNT